MGLRLYRIYNSPDIEKGADVEQALQEFVDKDQPGVLRMAGGQPEDFGSAISSAGRKIINIGREGLEKTVPSIFDFFGGAEAGESAQDFLEAEFMPEGYGERGGLSKEQIDNVVIAASGGRGSISDDIDTTSSIDEIIEFIMSREDYTSGSTNGNYVMWSGHTSNGNYLNFGDEAFFFGTVDAQVFTTTYKTIITVVAANYEYNSSTNDTFNSIKCIIR